MSCHLFSFVSLRHGVSKHIVTKQAIYVQGRGIRAEERSWTPDPPFVSGIGSSYSNCSKCALILCRASSKNGILLSELMSMGVMAIQPLHQVSTDIWCGEEYKVYPISSRKFSDQSKAHGKNHIKPSHHHARFSTRCTIVL